MRQIEYIPCSPEFIAEMKQRELLARNNYNVVSSTTEDETVQMDFQLRVMVAIQMCQPEAYGVPVLEYLEELQGKQIAAGAVTGTFRRLADKGWVESRLVETGGRAKVFYTVTPKGLLAMQAIQADAAEIVELVAMVNRTGVTR